MTKKPEGSAPQKRIMRVFVSSTFRDMHAEREELIKRVFPQLRKLCEERGVAWGEVDLRWGITSEQATEGQVLPICLEEIKRCRPFFIGLLGERHGWIPDEIPQELVDQEEWLDEHRDTSVTELEILHGVLNNPEMADHAFFYFRDPRYLDRLPTGARREDFVSENPTSHAKLIRLKNRIRSSGFPVQENYPDPQALGNLVLKDFTGIINQLFPKKEIPDPLDKEAAEHEAFAQSHAGVYIGRQEYFDRLNAHITSNTPPLVILGESGLGKSALLSSWSLQYCSNHPDDILIKHFIGTSAYSADWVSILRRIMDEFKRHFNIDLDTPHKLDELRAAFSDWLHIAAARASRKKRKIVLILDALNQLDNRDQAPDLVWLPPVIPENIRLILSTLPGRPLDELKKRSWHFLTIKPLRVKERKKLIEDYLSQYKKSLSSIHSGRIAASKQASNPLFLRSLLEELRLFGIHEQLDERITYYLEAHNIPDLFTKILNRYENDYERDRPNLVRDTLTLIWAARRGLSEAELLELLGSDGEPMPRAYWSPLYLALENSLVFHSNLIAFAHEHIRRSVQTIYLNNKTAQKDAHKHLAQYFDKQKVSARKIDEMPWQWQQAEKWKELKDCLTDLELAGALAAPQNRYMLGNYWLSLSDFFDMEKEYLSLVSFYLLYGGETAKAWLYIALPYLGVFLKIYARWETAEIFLKKSMEIFARLQGRNHPDFITLKHDLAELYRDKGEYEKAEPLYEEVLHIQDTKDSYVDSGEKGTTLNNLGLLHKQKGNYAKAKHLYLRALALRKKAKGDNHPDVAQTMNNLANLYNELGEKEEALTLYQNSLKIRERWYGPDHPKVATALINLAAFQFENKKISQAEHDCTRALKIVQSSLGSKHPALSSPLVTLGNIEESRSHFERAKQYLVQAMEVLEQSQDRNSHHMGAVLLNLAHIYEKLQDNNNAETYYLRAMDTYQKGLGQEHPILLSVWFGLWKFYEQAEKKDKATNLMVKILNTVKSVRNRHFRDKAAAMFFECAKLKEAKRDFNQARYLEKCGAYLIMKNKTYDS